MVSKSLVLLFVLLSIGCATGTTYEERFAVVFPVFMDQLDRAEDRLVYVEEEFQSSSYSEDAHKQLTKMAGDIRTEILEIRFALARAGAEFDGEALKSAADTIPAIFAKTERLHYLVVTSDFE